MNRKGFTLIELLIVVVIIGILAAIAIPKFGQTRDRAYFSAMQSDLRQLQAAQEIFYSSSATFTYAAALADLTGYQTSTGVTVAIAEADTEGWSATAVHAATGGDIARGCAIYVGEAAAVAPATAPGVIACQGQDG